MANRFLAPNSLYLAVTRKHLMCPIKQNFAHHVLDEAVQGNPT
jgi:hypothetical protein